MNSHWLCLQLFPSPGAESRRRRAAGLGVRRAGRASTAGPASPHGKRPTGLVAIGIFGRFFPLNRPKQGLGLGPPAPPICNYARIWRAPGGEGGAAVLFCLYLRGSFFQRESKKKKKKIHSWCSWMRHSAMFWQGGKEKKKKGEKKRKKKKSNFSCSEMLTACVPPGTGACWLFPPQHKERSAPPRPSPGSPRATPWVSPLEGGGLPWEEIIP